MFSFSFLQENACKHVDGMSKFMASPQCIDPLSGDKVTKEICLPTLDEVLRCRIVFIIDVHLIHRV